MYLQFEQFNFHSQEGTKCEGADLADELLERCRGNLFDSREFYCFMCLKK